MKKLARKITMIMAVFSSLQIYAQNIGIGVTDPQFILDVGGRMMVRSGGDAQNTAGIWFNNTSNTTRPAFFGMFADNKVGFYGNGSGWGMIMNTDIGFVGIGNTNPSKRLDVNGEIRASDDISSGSDIIANGNITANGNFSMGIQYLVSTKTIPKGTSTQFVCLCPIYQKVLGGGGGHNLTNNGQPFIVVNSSVPLSDGSGWLVRLSNTDQIDSHIVQIWAICAKVQ